MARPIIMTIDDEPQVLAAVERDLRERYAAEYRILKAQSGEEALEAARELKKRGIPVALFLVDQRMPRMSGTEFLAEARKLHPDAKTALLTAYADTQAAITSINELGLDYYLMKPWDPPEREFYPVIDDLLSDWTENVRLPYDGIRVVGTLWSAKSHAIKEFLSRNQVPYLWLDMEKSEEGRHLVELLEDDRRFPAVFFPDGSRLLDPEIGELAAKVGLQSRAAHPFYELIIIGGGPAGLAAAVYGGSEGLRTILIEREATGGQAGTSSLIENYLGFPRGLSGADLARRATVQARRFGVEILLEEVVAVRIDDSYRYVRLRGGTEISCHALLVATGVSVRRLDVPGVERLTGAGIYYGAAATEAADCRGLEVMVVGGANSAGQGALYLSRFASRVYLTVRGSTLESGMSRYLVDQIRATGNIEVVFDSEVTEAKGETRLESVMLRNRQSGEVREQPIVAMFIFIGAMTHTEMLDGLVSRDSGGFILTGADLMQAGRRPSGWTLDRDPYHLETNIPGIFASGDVRHMSVKRVASGVGEGAVAVSLIHEYLKTV